MYNTKNDPKNTDKGTFCINTYIIRKQFICIGLLGNIFLIGGLEYNFLWMLLKG